MKSRNFEFLRGSWPGIASLGGFAEAYAYADPEGSVVKQRAYVEQLVHVVYETNKLPQLPRATFMDLLESDTFKSMVPQPVLDKIHAVRIHGNKAAHGDKCSKETALWLIKECWQLGRWLSATVDKVNVKDLPAFIPPQVTKIVGEQSLKAERKSLMDKFARQEAQINALIEESEKERQIRVAAEQQLDTLQSKLSDQQVAAAKWADDVSQQLEFNEQETRERLIDSQLASVGWEVAAGLASTDEVVKEENVLHQPTNSGTGRADYVLRDDNGKALAVIEAKKTAVDAEAGRHQAKIYADGIEQEEGQRPVIFYSNGYDIWIWDDHPAQGYPPRKLYGFYSKRSLQYLVHKRSAKNALEDTPVKEGIIDRLYQHEALSRICERYAGGHRKALAVQATGTGKTRLAIALTDRLLKAGWAKRVLFLCDRRELRKQAKNAYSNFLEAPAVVLSSKTVEDDENQIFLATYPAMQKIYQNFDPGFFDLIIADESHRSIYNIYGDLFRYFDSLQLGLTATPVEMVSRSTCQLFGCDFKHPTTNYPLEKAIEDGYLSPYTVVKHTTKFLRDGIKAEALSADQIAQLEDQGIDPNTLDFSGKDIDRAIYNKDTNRLVLRNLMENGIRMEDGQTLGKTIVFARNHRHAILLESLFDELYPQYAGKFCQVIDNYDPRAEELIDDFKGEGKNDQLTIAISVDMLDTGIDVPEIVNLVFARPVKSPVKFWQMVGRGTRLCEDLFGSGKDKTAFQIFDHWGVVEYHGMKQRDVVISQSKPLMQRVFEARLELAQLALEKAEISLFDQLSEWISKSINSLDENTIAVRDKWKLKQQLSRPEVVQLFDANTVVLLQTEIAPLMRWLDIRGSKEAYQWDLLMTEMMLSKIKGAGVFDDQVAMAVNWLHRLRMNLSQVRARAKLIKQAIEPEYWSQLKLVEIEKVRLELRGVAKYVEKFNEPGDPRPIIDLPDSDEQHEEQTSYLSSVDNRIYIAKVEQVLIDLFDQDPILKKIREGVAVSEEELVQLNSLIHTHNPQVDLNTLRDFYDSAAPMDQVIRSVIGMDAKAVNARFVGFVQDSPKLTGRQIQFLTMLKRQIAKSGPIELSSLYELPYVALGDIEELFEDEAQINEIFNIISSFGQPANIQSLNGDEVTAQ